MNVFSRSVFSALWFLLLPFGVNAQTYCQPAALTGIKLVRANTAVNLSPAWSASQAYIEGSAVRWDNLEYVARW
jgi:hypothetical protein